MFDTHVNLHGEQFAEDLEEVLQRARRSGVTRMITICDRLENFDTIKSLAHQHDDIWCSVGVHPHYSDSFEELDARLLISAARDTRVVAIGETGLDFHYEHSARNAQVTSLRSHIVAAQETGLPLILHARNADDLMGDILEETWRHREFVPLLHCYTGGERLLKRGLSLGAYVSASGIISFKNADDVREVIKQVPIDRIVVETDSPYLAPVPYRGRRNEPAFLSEVIAALASLFDMETADMAHLTEQNAIRLFAGTE